MTEDRIHQVRLIAGVLSLVSGLGLAVFFVMSLPDEHVPWTELDLEQPVGLFTETKLQALKRNPEACFARLESSALEFAQVDDRSEGGFCGYDDGLRITRSATPYSSAPLVRCPLAASLYLWETQIIQPAAQEIFGQQVVRIEHYGTYSCRRVYGRSSGRVSQHASANAIDVAGFTLEDGTQITVLNDWEGEDDEARFLRAARGGACEVFAGVISPDYNAAHRDHFHLDMGPYDFCR